MTRHKRNPGKPQREEPADRRDEGRDDGNQGEGNRAADRRYREKATEFARSPRADEAAQEARRALESGELEADVIEADGDESPDRDDYADVEREQPSHAERERR